MGQPPTFAARPDSWRLRLRNDRDEVLGAAVLVDDRHAITCAHVLARGTAPPTAPTTVDIVGSRRLPRTVGRVGTHGWFPITATGLGDLAVIELDEPAPPDVQPARLSRSWQGVAVRVFGYPRGLDDGVWVELRVVGSGGPGAEWVQVDPQGPTGRTVGPGFSGGGAVDASGAVVGMVIAADGGPQRSGVAWMLPVSAMIDYWPALGVLPAAAPSIDEVVRLLLPAVEALSVMADPAGRQQVVDLLPAEIAASARRHSARRLDVLGILVSCGRHPGGIGKLLDVVRMLEGGTHAMRALEAVVDALPPGAVR